MFIIFSLIFGQTPESQPAPGEHALGEELITGEAEIVITDQKFSLVPQFDPWIPVQEFFGSESYVFDDELLKAVDSLLVSRQFLSSSYLRVPVERTFLAGDILVFLPEFEKRVANWELVIANSLGETVRHIKGKGQPPAVITWDGRTDDGEPIPTGDVYSFTFNAYDARGNQTRIPCEPMKINAVSWEEKNEWILSIVADELFVSDGATLISTAAQRLDEIANFIKEHTKRVVQEVVVYVYTEKEKLSFDRCAVMESEIGRRLVLPKDVLKVVPKFIPGLKPKQSRIEIHIAK
ncbi:MAG: FlgD immunoglobulin-like domain containing protein [candidate division WOR-3 bacterium]